jgi:hypothetical protein
MLSSFAQKDDCTLNKNKDMFFNANVEMVMMFECKFFDTIPICNNCEAVEIFEQRIDTLKLYIDKKDEMLLDKIIRIILNFELLTNIESESDGNFIGKYNPTERDVERWEEWFHCNKNNICWYKQKNILYLKRDL